jgi:hypothetical protein
MMNEKIKKWQSEIEKITAAQKEFTRRSMPRRDFSNRLKNISDMQLRQRKNQGLPVPSELQAQGM